MKLLVGLVGAILATSSSAAIVKHSGFDSGQPVDDTGKGAPILGMIAAIGKPHLT